MYKNDALQLSIVQRVYVVGCESMRRYLLTYSTSSTYVLG